MSKKDNIIKIQVTTDLELELDFSKKHLFVYSNVWKVKTLAVQQAEQQLTEQEELRYKTEKRFFEQQGKKELPSNKKVRASKTETQFEKFIQLFTLLDEMDSFDEGVSFNTIRQAVISKGIATEIKELNNLINEALSKDLIEGTDKYGFYRRKIN